MFLFHHHSFCCAIFSSLILHVYFVDECQKCCSKTVIGDAGVQGFGLRASGGKRSWATESEGGDDVGMGGNSEAMNADGANKLYVGLLIMLIFSEALALYGLIVALILSQHSYVCE